MNGNYLHVRVAAGDKGRRFAHREIAASAMGRPLAKSEQVHHVNYDPTDNANANLVICSTAYHRLLHQRTDALNASGNANYRKCQFCGKYDDPKNLWVGGVVMHRSCQAAYKRARNAIKKEK